MFEKDTIHFYKDGKSRVQTMKETLEKAKQDEQRLGLTGWQRFLMKFRPVSDRLTKGELF